VNAPNTKLYTELIPDKYVKGECIIVDDNEEPIMNHYYGTKLIPGCDEKIT
jgi:hypothetical protein